MSEKNGILTVVSPFTGKIIDLTDVPSGKFSSKMMGEGIAVVPEQGKAFSPVAGEIIQAFPTRHAVTIQTESNVEVLVQIGIGTEKLEGENFEIHVKEKDNVKVGDQLITFDLDFVRNNLESLCSPVIIVNPNKMEHYTYTNDSTAKSGETVLIEAALSDGESKG